MTAAATMTTSTNKKSKVNRKSNDSHSHVYTTTRSAYAYRADNKTIDTTNDNNRVHHNKTQKHPMIQVPTMTSLIMKNRLTNYQSGQLGHWNWIVTQYLNSPQQQQQLSKVVSSSSKRSTQIVFKDHSKFENTSRNSEPQQPPGHNIDTNITKSNNQQTNESNHTDTIKDTDEYKRARQILNQYVDQMRGINTVSDVPPMK